LGKALTGLKLKPTVLSFRFDEPTGAVTRPPNATGTALPVFGFETTVGAFSLSRAPSTLRRLAFSSAAKRKLCAYKISSVVNPVSRPRFPKPPRVNAGDTGTVKSFAIGCSRRERLGAPEVFGLEPAFECVARE